MATELKLINFELFTGVTKLRRMCACPQLALRNDVAANVDVVFALRLQCYFDLLCSSSSGSSRRQWMLFFFLPRSCGLCAWRLSWKTLSLHMKSQWHDFGISPSSSWTSCGCCVCVYGSATEQVSRSRMRCRLGRAVSQTSVASFVSATRSLFTWSKPLKFCACCSLAICCKVGGCFLLL